MARDGAAGTGESGAPAPPFGGASCGALANIAVSAAAVDAAVGAEAAAPASAFAQLTARLTASCQRFTCSRACSAGIVGSHVADTFHCARSSSRDDQKP